MGSASRAERGPNPKPSLYGESVSTMGAPAARDGSPESSAPLLGDVQFADLVDRPCAMCNTVHRFLDVCPRVSGLLPCRDERQAVSA